MLSVNRMKANDIPEKEILEVIERLGDVSLLRYNHNWTFSWDICDSLNKYPQKVVMAKLAALVRRGVLSGCTCGCRGDFYIIDISKARL